MENKEDKKPIKASVDNTKGRPSFKRARINKRSSRKSEKPVDDFEQKIVDLARVTRVMAGGKRMKFRACMVIGDRKGKVGVGIAKGADVAMAVAKAVTQAKRNLVTIPIIDGTIPHKVEHKFKASRLMLKPARKGTGIKAGGVVRIVLNLSGLKDVSAKILGGNNKVNNAKATLEALQSFVVKPEAKKKIVDKDKETVKVNNDKKDK